MSYKESAIHLSNFSTEEGSIGDVLSVEGYTYSRHKRKEPEPIDESHKDCFCKITSIKIESNKIKKKYHIKAGPDGILFDPWGMFSEGTQSKVLRYHGKPQWEFKEVNEKCFEFYKNFLKYRNNSWLKNAQREIM